MKRLLSLALLGMVSAALAGCEASAKVDTDGHVDSDGRTTYSKTTVRRDVPAGDTTYERKTESRTTINP
jgi:hypothetical protein